jgi:DNA-binding transcriptional MerR regulator
MIKLIESVCLTMPFSPSVDGGQRRNVFDAQLAGTGVGMAKSSEAFRTISEVAEELGVPKHVLRFWEIKFPQIRPMKRGGGRRYYRPEDVELLRGIRVLLHAEGFTIRGVQKILREQGMEQVKASGESGSLVAEATRPPTPRKPAKKKKATSSKSEPSLDEIALVVRKAIDELEACRKMLA